MALLLGATTPGVASAICLPLPASYASTFPAHVVLVGRDGAGTTDPLGEFLVVVRNDCNVPLAGRVVEVTFAGCGDVRIASSGYPPGVTVDCSPTHRSVRRLTDAAGEARFAIPGIVVPGAGGTSGCASIVVEGSMFGRLRLATADLDGVGGVGANDLSLWLRDFGASDPSLGDYDGDGAIGANDLSLWLEIFAAGGSIVAASPLCP